MKKILFLLYVLLSLFVLGSCGEAEDSTSDGNALTLNVYNWGEYISDGSLGSYDTNAEFEKYYYEKTGVRVKVNYTTYATNEDMYAKITSGAGTYDILIPSDYMIEKLISEDFLYAFDPYSTVENYSHINDDFKTLYNYYDPENLYSVPYTYGMVGILYNDTMVDLQDVESESWGLLWNEKYRGKILQFNNPRDAFGSAMYYHGIDINSTDRADWDLALEKLIEQKPLVQGYVSDEIFNKMVSGSAAIAPYYAGDYLTMVDPVDGNENLSFYYPGEGTNVFVDAMCIPKNAKNKELAIEYINFMLSETTAIENALYIGYASPNDLVKNSEYYQEEMGEFGMDILYGKSAAEANVNYPHPDPFYHSFTPDMQSYVNGLWEELKTESAIEPWIHVTAALIVLGVAGFGVYRYAVRRMRSRHYRVKR